MASLLRPAAHLAALSPRAKVAIMIGGDAVFLPLCMMLAVAFRLGSLDAAVHMAPLIQLGVALLALPALGIAGLYRTVVRYIDLRVFVASSAALAAVVLVLSALAWIFEVVVLPRTALPIFWFVAFAYVVTSRFIARSLLRRGMKQVGRHRVRTAIYGAGDAGAQLAQAMQLSPDHLALCFLDDRADLQHKIVAGLPVYSPSRLGDAIFRHELEEIVLAIPSASSAQKRRLIERVEGAGLPVKILPGLFELVDGKAGMSDIREVDVADLLGRDPVPPDPALFARNIAGKIVLVTGAGGSIGSELCRQIVVAATAQAAPARSLRVRALHHRAGAARQLARRSSGRLPRLGARRAPRPRDAAHAWRQDDLSRRRLQARADGRSEHAAGPAQQRLRHAGRRPRRARRGGRDLRARSRPTRRCARPTSWAPPSAPPS